MFELFGIAVHCYRYWNFCREIELGFR